MRKALSKMAVLFFCMLAVACSGKRKELSDKQMKELMWDLSRVEAFQTYYLQRDTTINATEEGKKLYAKTFALHGVAADDFFFTLQKIRNKPEKYRLLLDSVNAYGTRLREMGFADTTQNKGNPARQ
jgi:hypothetical protein